MLFIRDTFLPCSPPLVGEEEIAEAVNTLESDWITTGPKPRQFEREFANSIGAPSALAVSSATDAMQVGLATLGVGPGGEVNSTLMTFCSTIHVIERLGASPVLVDVEPDALNIDPERVSDAITSRTGAIRNEMISLARDRQASVIIYAITHQLDGEMLQHLLDCQIAGLVVVHMPALYETLTDRVPVDHVRNEWMLPSAVEGGQTSLPCRLFVRIVDWSFGLLRFSGR